MKWSNGNNESHILISFSMSSNGLEDGSAHEIAVTLADKNSIQHIDLSCNNLTHTGMHVLIQSR